MSVRLNTCVTVQTLFTWNMFYLKICYICFNESDHIVYTFVAKRVKLNMLVNMHLIPFVITFLH